MESWSSLGEIDGSKMTQAKTEPEVNASFTVAGEHEHADFAGSSSDFMIIICGTLAFSCSGATRAREKTEKRSSAELKSENSAPPQNGRKE